MGVRLETERGCRGRRWSTIQILGMPFLSSRGRGIRSAWESGWGLREWREWHGYASVECGARFEAETGAGAGAGAATEAGTEARTGMGMEAGKILTSERGESA